MSEKCTHFRRERKYVLGMKKHLLAMVGFGGMAGWHYDLIEKIDNLSVAGIWDIKEERREYARSRQIPVYGSLEELLADEKVDIVLVATPNDVHKSIRTAVGMKISLP